MTKQCPSCKSKMYPSIVKYGRKDREVVEWQCPVCEKNFDMEVAEEQKAYTLFSKNNE